MRDYDVLRSPNESRERTRFVMLVGLPASGKSTAAEHLCKLGYKIHSSDALRKELSQKNVDPIDNNKLFQILHSKIKEDLGKGNKVVYDATNISRKRRTAFLQEIKRYDTHNRCVFKATDYKTCVERDSKRDAQVGEDVIKRMYNSFWVPQLYEGWDNIAIHWDFKGKNYDIVEKLNSLKGYDQDSPHHSLHLGEHMLSAATELANELTAPDLNLENNITTLLATQLHDIGKPLVRSTHPVKGHSIYYQHHLVGGYEALFFLKNLNTEDQQKEVEYFIGDRPLSIEEIMETVALIQWHMYPYSIKKDSTKRKAIKILGSDLFNKLMLLHEADRKAH